MRRFAIILLLGVALAATAQSAATSWRSVRTTSVKAWLPTAQCEATYNWHVVSKNGKYHGGLQFDHWTWTRFGGATFSYDADKATPQQQVLVASRVTYDAWPNCPQPPYIR